MTVTTNTLGTNSAEIVVFNHARYYDALTAVGSFLTSHGWTEKAGVGNALEKVYTSNNTLGSGVKEIKINAIDLHIQHADSFTGTTTVVATNDCEKVVHNEYLKYPENLFTSTTGSNTFNGSVTASFNPHTEVGDYAASSIYYLSSTILNGAHTITITAGLAVTLYKGQFIRLVSQNDPKNVYLDAIVDSHDNVTGVVTVNPFHKGPTSTTTSNWYLLTHSMNYDTAINPGYIYISASSKHCVIQCRNTGGYWHDFTAVCETENPLAVEDASILTTGYMLGNSGNTTNSYTQADTAQFANIQSPGDTSPVPAARNNYFNRLRIWTGPFSQPSTRKGRTGWNGRLSKITTPLGEVNGCIGISVTSRHTDFIQEYDNPTDFDNLFEWDVSTMVHWNSMGDIIPSTYEPVLGNYWALTGTVVTDLSDETTFSRFSIDNVMLDTWTGLSTILGPLQSTHGHPYRFNNQDGATRYSDERNADIAGYNTPTQKMQWRTSEPTLLGRIYNMKFVTSTLTPTNVLSIAIDANGFVDSSGVASDHIVFSYPSDYKFDSIEYSESNSIETSEKSERIKDTMSVAVAFPK